MINKPISIIKGNYVMGKLLYFYNVSKNRLRLGLYRYMQNEIFYLQWCTWKLLFSSMEYISSRDMLWKEEKEHIYLGRHKLWMMDLMRTKQVKLHLSTADITVIIQFFRLSRELYIILHIALLHVNKITVWDTLLKGFWNLILMMPWRQT